MGLERDEFHDTVLSLNPAYFHALMQGGVKDLGPNGLEFSTGYAVGGRFEHRDGKYGFIATDATTGLRIEDTGASDPTRSLNLTLFFAIAQMRSTDAYRLVSKRVAATDYELSWRGTGALFLTSTTSGSVTLAVPDRFYSTIAVSVVGGSRPRVYADGIYVGLMSGVFTPGLTGAATYLGSLGGGSKIYKPLQCALMFPSVLSDEQISDLHRLWLESAPIEPGAPKNPYFFLEAADELPIDATMSENFPMEFDSSGQVVGTQGASVGTRTGIITESPGAILPRALRASNDQDAVLEFSNPANILDGDAGAVECIITPDGVPGVLRYCLYSNANGTTYIAISSNRWAGQKGSPPVTITAPANSVRDQVPAHLILTWWSSGATLYLEFFLDGESLGTSSTTNLNDPAVLRIFHRTAGNGFSGRFDLFRTYSTRVTPADARTLYLQYATKPVILSPRFEHPVTLWDVTSGYAGPWLRGSGTWQYTDDGERRILDNRTAGYCTHPSAQAFGGWYFRIKKAGGSNTVFVIVGTVPAAWSDASQNGYLFNIASDETIRVWRVTAGGLASVCASAVGYLAADVEYEVFVSRSCEDATFSVYVRGGAYTSWALACSGTNSTHVSSQFVVAELDAGDTLSDVIFFPMGGTIDPTAGDLDDVFEEAA